MTPQFQSFGDHGGNEQVPTSFAFGPITSIPGEPKSLRFHYNFVNSGFAASGEGETNTVLDGISDAAEKVAAGAFPAAAALFPLVNKLIHAINAWLFSSCDGIVATDDIQLSSLDLFSLTASGPHTELRFYPGSPSPDVCGEESHYHVQFTINRTSR